MNIKDDMEEGEISDISDGEEPLGGYTLLERPVTAKAILPQNSNNGKEQDTSYQRNEISMARTYKNSSGVV